MFGIIIKSYLAQNSWECYNANTKNIIMNTCTVCITGKRKILVANITVYLLKSVQNIIKIPLSKIILYHLVGHNLVQWLNK